MSLRSNKFIFVTTVCLYTIAMVTTCTAMPITGSCNSEAPTMSSRELEEVSIYQVYNGLSIVQTMIETKLLQGGAPAEPVVRVEACIACGFNN